MVKKIVMSMIALLCCNYVMAQGSEPTSAQITIGSGLHVTYYNNQHDYQMPEGCVGIFFFLQEGGYGDDPIYYWERGEAYESGEKVPKGEALIIYSPNPGTYTLEFDKGKEKVTPNQFLSLSLLFGTDENTDLKDVVTDKKGGNIDPKDYYYYGLSYDDKNEHLGFYWRAENGAPFTNAAHKAYLRAKKSIVEKINAQSKGITGFGFDDISTEIEKLLFSPNAKDSSIMYDLTGRRLKKKPSAGMYIKNGKKIIVR